jgi:cytochrome c oxidase subunit IV
MRDPLKQILERYKQPDAPTRKLLIKLFLSVIAALAIAYAANWLLDYFHLDPFGIREMQW